MDVHDHPDFQLLERIRDNSSTQTREEATADVCDLGSALHMAQVRAWDMLDDVVRTTGPFPDGPVKDLFLNAFAGCFLDGMILGGKLVEAR
jgi:hypothetical protein